MPDENRIETLKAAIASGAAILLVGAGFSRSGTDANSQDLPSTDDLIAELKTEFDLPGSEQASLADIADYASDSPILFAKLRSYLIRRLVSTKPNDAQISLVKLPWRAVFTTNFDDIVEQSVAVHHFATVTPITAPSTIPSDKTPFYYLHGRARDLIESDLDPALVISERNYLNLDTKNRDLYARLYNEVFSARAVVLVGYSLRDLEVAQGLLKRGASLRDKTTIFCAATDGEIARNRLAKFGSVIPTGLDGAVALLGDVKSVESTSVKKFQFLQEVEVTKTENDTSVDDFIELLLRGKLNGSAFLAQRGAGDENHAICVDRRLHYEQLLDSSDQHTRRFIVSADFGNGKSTFLKQLAIAAIERGHRVVEVKTKLEEIFDEIAASINSGERFIFLIDDVVRYREVARYIGNRANSNVTLVCTTRGEQDDRAYEALEKDLGGAVRHIDLNLLNDDEISQWDIILERWGFWGSKIQRSPAERRKFITEQCGRENRSVVLSLFRDSELAERIDRIVDFFLKDSSQHKRAFAALLISSLCQQHVSWPAVVAWLDIDEDALRRDIERSDIAGIFQGGRNWNAFTSAQLAEFILRNRYMVQDNDILATTYSTIVLETADSSNDSRSGLDARENLKELMKFRFLTRLFGDDVDAIALVGRVYQKLSNAKKIRGNPQFWLQYAMSRIEIDDLENAEIYLETAIGLAKERGVEYSPFQILDQRSRLYLRKSVDRAKHFNRVEVRRAITDLVELTKDRDYEVVYPFRAVPLINNVIEKWIDDIDSDTRKLIMAFLMLLKEKTRAMNNLPRSQKGETRVLYQALDHALLILRNG